MPSRPLWLRIGSRAALLFACLHAVSPASACTVCVLPGGDGLTITDPRILKIAIATRKAVENGIIPDTKISDARHSKGSNSLAQSPDEILLRFWAVKEPSVALSARESVHVLLIDTDRRFSLSGGASGLVVSADTSGTSTRLIITTRRTLLALLNRSLPLKEALECGLLLNEPTALQQRSQGDAPAPP
ncbi:MAG: hypothetical protein V4726_20115 [Verrucomicrobiota bacterium]